MEAFYIAISIFLSKQLGFHLLVKAYSPGAFLSLSFAFALIFVAVEAF